MSAVVFPKSPKRSARRCLFGRPSSEETSAWLAAALREIRERDTAKYGFDFELHMPVESTSAEYQFQPVSEAAVPEFYRTKAIATPSSAGSSPKAASDEEVSLMSCEDSDISMDFSISPVPPARRSLGTPKKRQGKLTEFMAIRRKRLQRSPKSVDGVGENSPRRRVASRL